VIALNIITTSTTNTTAKVRAPTDAPSSWLTRQ